MKRYNTVKNIIIAILSTVVFYMTLVDGIAARTKIWGLFIIFLATWSLFDGMDLALARRKPRMLTKEQFARYKEKIAVNVEGCRGKGKDEEWLKRHIINFISHDPRKIFTGPQIRELLSLAVSEKEKSA